jgi:hypothetical protein
LQEELGLHVELQAADNLRAGASPVDAKRKADLRPGQLRAITEAYREEQRLLSFEHVWQDIRYFLRQLRRAPLFTATAVLSIAIGIGASVAVFSVIDRLLLRPLPVPNPEQLVFIADQRIEADRSPRFSYEKLSNVVDRRVS